MKKISILSTLVALLLLSSCDWLNIIPPIDPCEDDDPDCVEPTPSELDVYDRGTPYATYSTNFNALFDPSNEIKLELEMSQGAILKMQQFGSNTGYQKYSDVYWPTDVKITINEDVHEFEEVGIRIKGNTSKTPFIDEDGNFFMNAHFKLDFTETFDDTEDAEYAEVVEGYQHDWTGDKVGKDARKARRLFDMEKLDIKWNKSDDKTHTRQAYAYKTFRDLGLASLHSNLSDFTLTNTDNGDTMHGVFEILETVDEIFIERNYTSSQVGGDVYKTTYTGMGPANFTKTNTFDFNNNTKVATIIEGGKVGAENERRDYYPSYDIKTNKKKTTHADLANLFGKVYDDEKNLATAKEKLESAIEMDQFLRFSAICALLGNPDDQRQNDNNYYLFFPKGSKKAIYIPYDYDWCLGLAWDNTEGSDPYRAGVSNSPFTLKSLYGETQNPLYYRVFNNKTGSSNRHSSYPVIKEYKDKYAYYLVNYMDFILNQGRFEEYVNKFATNDNTSSNISSYITAKRAAVVKGLRDEGYGTLLDAQ